MSAHQVHLWRTSFPCWKCGEPLWMLDIPFQGWRYHCQRCQHLTVTREELAAERGMLPAGAVGIVAAVPCWIEIQ